MTAVASTAAHVVRAGIAAPTGAAHPASAWRTGPAAITIRAAGRSRRDAVLDPELDAQRVPPGNVENDPANDEQQPEPQAAVVPRQGVAPAMLAASTHEPRDHVDGEDEQGGVSRHVVRRE